MARGHNLKHPQAVLNYHMASVSVEMTLGATASSFICTNFPHALHPAGNLEERECVCNMHPRDAL